MGGRGIDLPLEGAVGYTLQPLFEIYSDKANYLWPRQKNVVLKIE